MPKSKDAFRTISEVAEWMETPAHVLRFWESKFTQVKPVKRAGGRRYYRPADMQLLGGIKKLLHDDGLTIKGAQKLLREHGVKHVAALSQPLDEALRDEEDIVAEAAFESDAQPEPMVVPAPTVLSFPNRSEPVATTPPDIEPYVPEAPVTPEEPNVPEVAAQETITAAPTTDNSTDTPAFGSDALPAFLRRTPTPAATVETPEPETTDVASADETLEAQKLTINPEAYFEPVNPPEAELENLESASEPELESAETQLPMFAHRESTHTDTPATTVEDTPPVPVEATPPEQAAPALDIPSAAKIAPELDSYTAPPGVLAALPGTRQIAPELAAQVSEHLSQLRALRERMQNH